MKFKLKGDVPKEFMNFGILQPGEIFEENREDFIEILKGSPLIEIVKEQAKKPAKKKKEKGDE